MIISKKQRIDKLLIRDIKIFKSESIFFPVILSFIIVLFYFRGISSATTDLHIASGHTKANSDSAHLTLQRKNDKRKFFDSSDNDAEPWSNAFNFEKSWKASVDPRTGVLMVHFKVGGLLSNIGHGPDINLQINYNSNTVADPDGIGSGWSWNLTHFNHTTDQLTTTNGQIFWLHQAGRNHWKPLYHKLYDIKIAGDKSRHFTITYANGLREILSHDGYETRLEQQNGWGVNFIYYRGTHLLQSVIDDEGNKITIDRSESYLDIISHKSDGKPAIIRIKKHNNKPDKLVFLADHQSEKLSISLNYNNRLLNHIVYPSGLEKKFIFNCTNEMKISVLHSNHFYSLCVVTAEETDPGAGQPVMKVRHFYSRANVNDHNYLGFNSGLTALAGSKRDILFDSPADYSYRTVTDNGLVKEIHTYNKYHLLIDDKMISNHTGKILSETENFFCNTKIPDGCSQTSLSKLPATYGLPLKIVNRVWGNASGFPAVTVETKSYNSSGQIIRSTDAYGRVTITHYCPFEGDIACPAQSHGWFFSVLPKSITSYPAPMINNIQPQIPNKIYNFYRRKTNLNGNGYILILDHQIRKADNKRIILKRHYYLDRTNILTYGLLRQTILSDTTINSPHAIIRDYNYTQNNKNHSRTTDISIELSPNKRQRISSVTTSLFTNQVLEKVSSCGLKKTDYHYDTFNRLIQTDLDKGTAFAATLHYQYVVAPGNNYFIVTKVNGLQQKIVFDNAGREIMRFNQMISASGDAIPGHWQLKKSLHYDNYGHVTEQKNYKLKTTGQSYTLKTIKSYDDMGRISHINLPNGEMDFRLYDNPDRCMISYQQSNQGKHSPVYIVQMNLLGKPTKKRVVSAFLEPLPSVKSLCSFKKMASDTVKTETTMYDGWGRPVITEDVMGRVTRTHYNALGHPDDITDPVGNHIHLVYDLNGKVTEHWALPVNGGRYLLSSAGYNSAGKILCKAGEDGKKTTFTYTQTGQLATAITPDGHKFLWQYNEAGLPVAKYIDGKVLLQTSYNHITAQPIKKQDISGVTTWKYSVDGLIEEEKHTGKNGYPDYYLSWNYNSERKIISSADITGDMTHIKYDRLGRIAVLSYQNKRGSIQILYTPNYDAFSRINTIRYGSGMQRTIHYDGWGNQLDIADTLNKQLLSRWQFNYNEDNNIVRLRQQAENNQEAILKYQYDQLDNLVSMYCNGSFGLPLCPRDTAFSRSDLNKAPIITSQSYTFTPLNRLSQIKEVLQNTDTQQTLSKTVAYHYNNIKVPLRLQETKTQWNQQTPVTQHLHYDSAGNMTIDGEGNHITYNIFNQITRIVKPDGKQSYYTYDDNGLERLEENASVRHYLFYSGKKLINEKVIGEDNDSHIIGYHGTARSIDNVIREYTEQNYKNDIVGILTKTTGNNSHLYQLTQRNIYSPYGMVWHNKPAFLTLPLRNSFGFDGEHTDPATGWQFLGAGHRTYNPRQRYFVSEDPAGNGYAFASNNPVMKTDPSGNMSKSLKRMIKIFRNINSLGAINSSNNLVRGFGSLAMIILSSAFIVGSMIVWGAYWPAAITTAGMIPCAVISATASQIPENKGLNIAAAVVGTLQLSAIVVPIAATISLELLYCCCSLGSLGAVEEATNTISTADSLSIAENIEMTGLTNTEQSMTALENRLLRDAEDLFVRKDDGGYLNMADHNSMQRALLSIIDHTGVNENNNAGTVLSAAMLNNKSLKISKLEEFLSAQEDFPIASAGYRNAFKSVMASLDIPAVTLENNTFVLSDLFPLSATESITAIVGKNSISLIQANNDQFIPYVTNGIFSSQVYNYDQVMEPLFDSFGKLFIYEYYRIK